MQAVCYSLHSCSSGKSHILWPSRSIRQEEYNNAGIIVFPSVQGLDATRFQNAHVHHVHRRITATAVSDTGDRLGYLIVGTGLGLWWLYGAWDGYSNEKPNGQKVLFRLTDLSQWLICYHAGIDILIKYLYD